MEESPSKGRTIFARVFSWKGLLVSFAAFWNPAYKIIQILGDVDFVASKANAVSPVSIGEHILVWGWVYSLPIALLLFLYADRIPNPARWGTRKTSEATPPTDVQTELLTIGERLHDEERGGDPSHLLRAGPPTFEFAGLLKEVPEFTIKIQVVSNSIFPIEIGPNAVGNIRWGETTLTTPALTGDLRADHTLRLLRGEPQEIVLRQTLDDTVRQVMKREARASRPPLLSFDTTDFQIPARTLAQRPLTSRQFKIPLPKNMPAKVPPDLLAVNMKVLEAEGEYRESDNSVEIKFSLKLRFWSKDRSVVINWVRLASHGFVLDDKSLTRFSLDEYEHDVRATFVKTFAAPRGELQTRLLPEPGKLFSPVLHFESAGLTYTHDYPTVLVRVN